MHSYCTIKPPFFEIGPKSYLYGNEVTELARFADEASMEYDVDIIFTTPVISISEVKKITKVIHIFAPHMDPLLPGRGIAEILPESLICAGAEGVMLNHNEKPLSMHTLKKTLQRAEDLSLTTIVCADSLAEASAVAALSPDIIVAEPSELIGSGHAVDSDYVASAVQAVHRIDDSVFVLVAAGIHSGNDVYEVISCGADATGSSSGIATAENRRDIVFEMVGAVRRAWDDRIAKRD